MSSSRSIALSPGVLSHVTVACLASCLIAAASQVSVSFPFTSVPFTLQPHAVLFLSALLGPKRALLAVFFYLLEGALGAPVFAAGKSGVFRLIGPSGGYLLSYLPVSWVVGHLFSGEEKPLFKTFGKLLAGNALIILLGASFLSLYVGPKMGFAMGVTPFIATDTLKTFILASILSTLSKKSFSQFFHLHG